MKWHVYQANSDVFYKIICFTKQMYDCLRKLERLDPNTKIYPNHVGEAHAIASEESFSTIGKELESNEAIQIKDRDEFYTYMTEGWPPKPEGYLQIIKDNLKG